MILYYITDRKQLPGDETSCRGELLEKIDEAAKAGVDFIQLREKDLPIRELEQLAREAAARVEEARRQGSRTKLLINSRSDVALACGADGVHLTSNDISAGDVRAFWMHSRAQAPLITVSCHSIEEVRMAGSQGADFALLAPIFGKQATGDTGIGLAALKKARRAGLPVLALGGVTRKNAASCIRAGAVGIAGIRIFQENSARAVVGELREK